jgi:hypothetical protein
MSPRLSITAVALPAEVAMVFISRLVIPNEIDSSEVGHKEKRGWSLLSYLIPVAQQVSFFAVVLALFWSFQPVASGLFLVVSLVSLLAVKQVEIRP